MAVLFQDATRKVILKITLSRKQVDFGPFFVLCFPSCIAYDKGTVQILYWGRNVKGRSAFEKRTLKTIKEHCAGFNRFCGCTFQAKRHHEKQDIA